MMMASATPTGTTSDVSPFPRGFAWRSASPTAMELTDHLHQADSRPEPASEASPTASKALSRPNMTASSTITLAMLRPHFEEPLAQVAQSFGICVTLLKKICRRHGIARWPHRQISGLRKSIASMEHAIGYFEGERRESYAAQLNKQRVKLELLLRDPTSSSLLSPSSQAAAAAASISSISASKFEDEDEDERSSMGSPNGVGFMYDSYAPASSVSPTAYAQAYYPERHSMPEAFAFHSSPGRYESSPTPTLPPLQGVLHPEHFHYQQQQQQQQFEYEQGFYRHHEQHSAFPAAHRAPAIPPLRSEPKPLLPPISSLVVPASGGRASW